MNIEAILGATIIIVGIIIFYLGSRKARESGNLSKYVPVDDIKSIPFEVPVVVDGTVAADQPLISPVTKKPCVYYDYILEKETEIKDSNGNTSWEWKQVGSSQKETIPFYLQDQRDKILVKPDNCEVNGIFKTQQFLQIGTIDNSLSKDLKLLADAFQFSTNTVEKGNRERVTEYTIFTGANLNVFGLLSMEGDQKFFQKINDYPLVLSPLTKDQLIGSEKKTVFIYYALAVVLVVFGILLFVGL